ncbi:hypothetical protein ANN_22608 [Periplaneta americana]|uniref:Uncharacterized protein n=1 Tax=Periplaneta americana TaxID=6978 RepID=A0ABQ8S8L0_PERAM|nr:hypothetical protein ANN_22608 [Periplaneta americana]
MTVENFGALMVRDIYLVCLPTVWTEMQRRFHNSWLFKDAVSTMMLFSVDEIGDSEMVFGEMRPRIRHRLPGIYLTVGENLGKNPTRYEFPLNFRTTNQAETIYRYWYHSINEQQITKCNFKLMSLLQGRILLSQSKPKSSYRCRTLGELTFECGISAKDYVKDRVLRLQYKIFNIYELVSMTQLQQYQCHVGQNVERNRIQT